MEEGFAAIEAMLAKSADTGRYCHGDSPTLADAFLVPQIYSAQLAKIEKIDLAAFPTIRRVCDECDKLAAFDRARPERQPDVS
jgi:maleylacetoacetate isomerase